MFVVVADFTKMIYWNVYLKNAWHFALLSKHSPRTEKMYSFHQFYSNTNVNSTITQYFKFMKLSVVICWEIEVKDLPFEIL